MGEDCTARLMGAPRWLRVAGDWRLQLALGVAALGLAVAVGMAFGRRSARGAGGPAAVDLMPEAFPINDSWRAAAEGDAEAYLRCFTGAAREECEARRARLGPEEFRKELRAAAEAALGIEWGPPQPLADGGQRFPVRVFHGDDAEQFDYTVVKVGKDWRIRSVERRGRQAVSPPYAERLGPPGTQGGKR